MANFSALKTAIQNAIKQNGNEEITGDVLQQILLSIVSTMGDSAINTIEQNLSQETLARQNGDNTLQSNINAEALARGNADTQLQNAINAIKANIDNGYVYAGIATPSSTPVSGKVFYAALQAGTYTNFGGTAVTEGITFLKYNGTSWIKEQVLFTDGGVFDISAYHATGGNLATYADLSAALGTNGANVPENVRKGGMSVKYVQSSDNKYVQYRLMSDSFNTTVANWQGVDDEPTAGSDNLVKSRGVYQNILKVETSTNKKIGGIVYEETKNTSILSPQVYGNIITVSLIDAGVSVGDIVDLDIQTDNTISYNLYYTKDGGRTSIIGVTKQGNYKKENYTIPLDATGFQVYVAEGATNNKNVYLGVIAKKGIIDKNLEALNNSYTYKSSTPTPTNFGDVLNPTLEDCYISVGDVVELVAEITGAFQYNLYIYNSENVNIITLVNSATTNRNLKITIPEGAHHFRCYIHDITTAGTFTFSVRKVCTLNDLELILPILNNVPKALVGLCYKETAQTPTHYGDVLNPTLEECNISVGDNIELSTEMSGAFQYNLNIYNSENVNIKLLVNNATVGKKFNVTIPEGAHHFRFYIHDISTAGSLTIYMQKLASRKYVVDYAPTKEQLNELDAKTNSLINIESAGKWINGSEQWYTFLDNRNITSFIPVKGGDILSFNISGTNNKYWLLKDNVVGNDGTSPNFSDYEHYVNGPVYEYQIPDDVKYIGFNSKLNGVEATIKLLTINGVYSNYNTVGNISLIEKDYFKVGDFLPILANMQRTAIDPVTGTPYLTYDTFRLLFYTDIHHDIVRNTRLLEFRNRFLPYFNDTLLCGDIAGGAWESTLDENFYHANGMTEVLKLLGNHDIVAAQGETAPTAVEMYNRYMEGISTWNVVQPANAEQNGYCFYYKDYTAAKVRMICLDNFSFGYSGVQYDWFKDVLADALTNDYSVIACQHIPQNSAYTLFNTNFNCIDFESTGFAANGGQLNLIDDFINNGGKFICWLYGHLHSDFIGKYTEHSNQLFLALSAAMINYGSWEDCARVVGTESEDCFSLLGVDTHKNTLSMYRVGAQRDRYLRHKEAIILNYNTKELIQSY